MGNKKCLIIKRKRAKVTDKVPNMIHTILGIALCLTIVSATELKRVNNQQQQPTELPTQRSRTGRQLYVTDTDDEFSGPQTQPLQYYNWDHTFQRSENPSNTGSNERAGVDNHKPSFKNCKTYSPVVKEELPPGAFVIRVEAEDDDDDDIEYKFITAPAERPKFRIDAKTGVILTQHSFDRDEPIREKEVYITVRATDNGNPPLDDVCTFKVSIEDVNDNSPVFDKVKYDESISEDSKVGSIVTRITASDLDDGDNSYVDFEILSERDYQYFRIDKETGNLYLNKPIDRRPGYQYSINVRANNSKSEQVQDAQTEVRIRIVESNLRSPQFMQSASEPIILKENFNDYQKKLVSLSAISNIPDKPEIVFELLNGRTEQTNSKKTFVGDQQKNDFSIMLGKALDYETVTEYTLTVIARNAHELTAEYTIKIQVDDVNDNIPYFTQVDSGIVLENEPVGSQVMQVRAFDSDGTSANNIVSFELADNKEFFEIDPHTGNITTLVVFDREEREIYNVKVIAKDNSPSALYTNGKPNQGQQVFAITIGDKNDHHPKFKQDEYVAEMVSVVLSILFHHVRFTVQPNLIFDISFQQTSYEMIQSIYS